MADEEKGISSETLLLSFLVGAALGVGLIFFFTKKKKKEEEYGNEEGPLFI